MSKILMIYASGTGNTDMIADAILDYLKDHNYHVDVKVFDEDKINTKDVIDYDVILMGVYTWSDGEIPYEVEDFYEGLDFVDLTRKICGVFGSGDQFYDVFAGAVDIFYEQFEENGAKMIPIRLKIDLAPDEEGIKQCQEFAQSVIELMSEKVGKKR
ncbi:flavodoxin [Oceanobacillus senegalensis]|uniref:flavodoxin n=1 Tax=Oceanobacillus senegalensis TaxID=1936063 RepID=UPI000A30BD19|nr:flavodoxin [Oceanobacillus senegalensis]